MINMEDLRFTIEQMDSVYYSLCNIDTLVRAEDTPAELYTCKECIYQDTKELGYTGCPLRQSLKKVLK